MADNKKYYYLKLKENFFDDDAIIILESMENGYLYSNILLKLYLRSLKNEGKLMFNDRIPFNSVMLAKVTRHVVGDVEKAVKLFEELGVIEKLDNGAIYMLDIQNFIGESSTEADRKRAYRNMINEEKTSTGQMSVQMSDKSAPELEIKKSYKRDIKDILSSSDEQDDIPYKEIIDYLNEKAKTSYRSSSESTKKLIKARFNDGFTLDNFKTVIDKKCSSWLTDENMAKYLRPSTLFGTKFEQYLNEVVPQKPFNASLYKNNDGVIDGLF